MPEISDAIHSIFKKPSLHKQYGPVAVLHFDSHLDTWDTYFGEPCTHGTPFRRASEEGLILKENSLHVGTRGSIYDKPDLEDDARNWWFMTMQKSLQSRQVTWATK